MAHGPALEKDFELPSPAQITINIYDSRGRLVRHILSEFKELGEHVVHWDGRDNQGHKVVVGTYFAKLVASGSDLRDTQARKIILTR